MHISVVEDCVQFFSNVHLNAFECTTQNNAEKNFSDLKLILLLNKSLRLDSDDT